MAPDTMTELEYHSVDELIAEIMRRRTFQGVVIHSEHDCKHQQWKGIRNFMIKWNDNLTRREAAMVLREMATRLERSEGEDNEQIL